MKKELPEEVKKAFAEALKFARMVTVDTGREKNLYIVADDTREGTDKKVTELIDVSLKKGHSATYEGMTQWIEDEVVFDPEKEGAAAYKWDKHGNKVLCERILFTRNEATNEVTSKVLKKIYKDWLKVGD